MTGSPFHSWVNAHPVLGIAILFLLILYFGMLLSAPFECIRMKGDIQDLKDRLRRLELRS